MNLVAGVENDARESADTGALSGEEVELLIGSLEDEGDGDRLVRRWKTKEAYLSCDAR